MTAVIGVFSRSDENSHPGGDTVQSRAVTEFLRKHGFQVHRLQLSESLDASLDLGIVFNLTRPIEAYLQARSFVSSDIPYILFPVYWDLDRLALDASVIGKMKSMVPTTVKDWARFRKFARQNPDAEKRIAESDQHALRNGQKMIQYVLDHASCVCPNSAAEAAHLGKKFLLNQIPVRVIYNGFRVASDIERSRVAVPTGLPPDYICCVGAIGPRKNQLNLVRAVNKMNINLVVVGGVAPGAERYARTVKRIASHNVRFVGRQSSETVMRILKGARGHVQPSFIETPGLASLEAASIGCPIVVSAVSPVQEYFGEWALYCDPTDVDSIVDALAALKGRQPDESLSAYIRSNFQWSNVLSPMLEVVREIVGVSAL